MRIIINAKRTLKYICFITTDQDILILSSHFNFFSSKFFHMSYMETTNDWVYFIFLGRDKENMCPLVHSCWLISWVLHAFVLSRAVSLSLKEL